MVKKCIVFGCRNESFKDCGLSFFKFPKDEPMRQRWINAVGRVTKYSVVCHLHFKPDDIMSVSSKPRLSPTAVPSIFPNIKIQNGLADTYSCLKDPVIEIEPLNTPSTCLDIQHPCENTDFSDLTQDTGQFLREKVKILKQRYERRDEEVKEMKNDCKMMKNECSTFDEVKNVLTDNFIDNQTDEQIESKGDKSLFDIKKNMNSKD